VASIIVAWGVAPWDSILPETLTIDQAAGPAGSLGALAVAAVLLVVIVVPSFAWL